MKPLDPSLVDHALQLAERYLEDTRPVQPPVIVASGPRAWFVLQTAVRAEKKAAEHLNDAGYETYLPTMRKEVVHRRRRQTIVREFVLFNRYLFAELPGSTRQWQGILADEAIEYVLGMGGVPSALPEAVVRGFMSAQEALEFDDTRDARIRRGEIGPNDRATALMKYAVGSRLRALRGPFGGFAGMVSNITARGTIEAMLEIFGRLTPVEFTLDMVAPD